MPPRETMDSARMAGWFIPLTEGRPFGEVKARCASVPGFVRSL